jgi:high-affinity iron transporter
MANRRTWSSILLFLPLVFGTVLVFFPRRGATGAPASAGGIDVDPRPIESSGLSPEQLVFVLQYVGSDYHGAVRDGQVADEFEYREMLEFTRTLVEEHGRLVRSERPVAGEGSDVSAGLEELRGLVEQKRAPAEVLDRTRELVESMTRELGLVTYPARAPRLDEGRRIFAVACAQCHGRNGEGNGPSAPGQNPQPTSFVGARMKSVAPHQLYNAIGFGVEGTAMPAYDAAYSPSQRWDVAFYLMTLRADFAPESPARAEDVSVRDLATLSDDELSAKRGIPIAVLDYYRSALPETLENDLLSLAERRLDESHGAFRRGDQQAAVRLSLEAYLEGIEPAESALMTVDRGLVRELEQELTRYRATLREGASANVVEARLDRLRALTAEAKRALEGSRSSFGFTFLQSATIILREGIEAALLVALLMSYLAAAGQPELRRYTLAGALAGVVAGLATWFAAQLAVESSTLQKEALEGITSILAAAVLFSVSFWIIQHADLKKWKSYIEGRARSALGTGSGLALAAVSFLAVYREGFETVLFYQALWLRSEGGTAASAVLVGLAAGLLALAVVVLLMFRYGKRIPLKPFFAVTGVLLGLLSFVFAGYGIAELQRIGWVQETFLSWVPSLPLLELQPTLEGLSLQLGIFLSFLLSWFLAGSGGESRDLKHARPV